MFWFVTLFFITFEGCFMFPLNNYLREFTGCFLLAVYIIYIGLFFVGLLRKNLLKVFVLTIFFTAVGMGLRYILEFGEVSNTMNFTVGNIIVSIFILPMLVTLVYWLYPKFNSIKYS